MKPPPFKPFCNLSLTNRSELIYPYLLEIWERPGMQEKYEERLKEREEAENK